MLRCGVVGFDSPWSSANYLITWGNHMPALSLDSIVKEARIFAEAEHSHNEPVLYGVTDGKAVGTYLEQKFVAHLANSYSFAQGNSASGIDLPELGVDIKVTSVAQPQSSCPFKSARQKIYGLGYHLLVFVYSKTDDHVAKTARLSMMHTIFVNRERTADYQMTAGILQILGAAGNEEDLMAFMNDRNLPVDTIEAKNLAAEILQSPPKQGYLTISNALQWRLQYARAIAQAGVVEGVIKVR